MQKGREDYLGAIYRLHLLYPKLHELINAYFNQNITPDFIPSLNRFYIRLVANTKLLLERGYSELDSLNEDFPLLPENFENVGEFGDEAIDWMEGMSKTSANFISKIEKLFDDEGNVITKLDKTESSYIRLIDEIILSINNSTKVDLKTIKDLFSEENNDNFEIGSYVLIENDNGSAKVVDKQNFENILVEISDTSLLSYKYFKYLWCNHDKIVRYKDLYELDGKTLPTRGERTKVNKSVSKQVGIIKKNILTYLPLISLVADKGYVLRYQESQPF